MLFTRCLFLLSSFDGCAIITLKEMHCDAVAVYVCDILLIFM